MIITDALQLSDEKPVVVTIRDTPKTNVIAIGLKKGQVLKRHVTPVPALLVVLRGTISFDMEGTQTELVTSSTFDIPPQVPHEVTGVEDSIFLVLKEKA